MISRSTRFAMHLLGLLAAGLLVGCGGGQVGVPIAPPPGPSQAGQSPQIKRITSAQSSAASPKSSVVSKFVGTWNGDVSDVLVIPPVSNNAALTLRQTSSTTLAGTLAFTFKSAPEDPPQIFDVTGRVNLDGGVDFDGKYQSGPHVTECIASITGGL
ncbi:MAG TPA: hypothetical protein VGZ00_01650, partial [Candidatus Baltobacteraceae bacterium]|nr:hypothetical protein [Candidatus Baltobacteraceae bacterium]